MKVLFVCDNSADYTAAMLWDGLRSVLGWQNVYAIKPSQMLSGLDELGNPCTTIRRWLHDGTDFQYPVARPDEDDFDLLIGVTSFLREEVWAYLDHQRQFRLKPTGKTVWVDTYDAATDVFNPPFPVDAVFKREIDPAIQYPYAHRPLPLIASFPFRTFEECDKPNDVFSVQMARSDERRWQVCPKVFHMRHRGVNLVGSGGIYPVETYMAIGKTFKLWLVAPGGGGQCDTPRQAECISCCSIPVFCAMPNRVHSAYHPSGATMPWFLPDEMFWVQDLDDLPRVLDEALDSDLVAMRERVKRRALRAHTTAARAEQFLKMIELDAWKSEK